MTFTNETTENQEAENVTDQQKENILDEKDPAWYKKRIDRMTAQKTALKTEAQEARAKAAALELELQKAKGGQQQSAIVKDSAAPSPDDFPAGKYDPDYIIALSDYKAEKREQERNNKQSLAQIERNVITSHKEARKVYTDFDDVLEEYEESRVTKDPEFKKIIGESDYPAELQYFLGSNPDELDKLEDMTPTQRIRYIGKLEAKITPLEQTKKVVSNANTPPSSIKASRGATGSKDLSEITDYAEYKKLRKSQQ